MARSAVLSSRALPLAAAVGATLRVMSSTAQPRSASSWRREAMKPSLCCSTTAELAAYGSRIFKWAAVPVMGGVSPAEEGSPCGVPQPVSARAARAALSRRERNFFMEMGSFLEHVVGAIIAYFPGNVSINCEQRGKTGRFCHTGAASTVLPHSVAARPPSVRASLSRAFTVRPFRDCSALYTPSATTAPGATLLRTSA